MPNTTLKLQAIRELIESIPPATVRDPDFNPMDCSGGNYDDAYQMGFDGGRSDLADEIRKLLA